MKLSFPAIIRRYSLLITTCCILGFAGMVIVTFISKPKFEVLTTLLFPIRTPSVLGLSGGAASLSAASLGIGTASPLRLTERVLKSRPVQETVSKRVGITVRDLKDLLITAVDVNTNTLAVSVKTENVELGKKIVRNLTSELESMSGKLNLAPMAADIETIKTQLGKQKLLLKQSQEALSDFQKIQKTAATVVAGGSGDGAMVMVLPGVWMQNLRQAEIERDRTDASLRQLRASIETNTSQAAKLPVQIPGLTPWRTKLVELQYQLQVAKVSAGPDSPTVKRLQGEIGETQKALEAEVSKYLAALKLNIGDSELTKLYAERAAIDSQIQSLQRLAAEAPEEASNYQSLLRAVAINTQITQRLEGQLSGAQLQSKSDPVRWVTLEDAIVSDHPTNKSYLTSGALGVILGGILSAIFIIVALWRKGEFREQSNV